MDLNHSTSHASSRTSDGRPEYDAESLAAEIGWNVKDLWHRED